MNKSNTLLCLLLTVLAPVFIIAADDPKGANLHEIKCLALAVDLADYPIKQGKLREQIFGELTTNAFGSWGSDRSFSGHTESFMMWTLTDPNDPSGYYSARLVYDSFEGEPKEFPISSITILFTSSNHLNFVYEPHSYFKRELPKLKSLMKKRGKTPYESAREFYKPEEEFAELEKTEALPNANETKVQ